MIFSPFKLGSELPNEWLGEIEENFIITKRFRRGGLRGNGALIRVSATFRPRFLKLLHTPVIKALERSAADGI